MAEPTNIDSLYAALISLRVVRHGFGNFLKVLAEGTAPNKSISSENNETSLQKIFNTFKVNFR